MTSTTAPEPLEALPIPDGAIELDGRSEGLSHRQLVVSALQQALAERRLVLPLGPETSLAEEGRLLVLNRFALLLASAGIGSDQLPIDRRSLLDPSTSPQLLLAALVDEENGVVAFPGVLTGSEFVELARQSDLGAASNGEPLLLETESFRGGIDRLFTLVQLLEPEAIARVALAPAAEASGQRAVRIADWLRGQVDGALTELFGAQWQPLTQGAFRGSPVAASANGLALVAIPLGLDGNQLVCGQAAERCLERFVLQMLAIGADPARPDGLVLRLSGAMAGDLLPDGLAIAARQGSHEQRQEAAASTYLELVFSSTAALIEVHLAFPGSSDLVLPPLQLPG